VGAALDEGAATELRYTGTLSKAGKDSDGQAVKRFTVYALVTKPAAGAGRELGFLVDERGGGSWAWPERFGRIALDGAPANGPAASLKLLYDHQGNLNAVRVPRPLFEQVDQLQPGAAWKVGNEAYEVVKQGAKIQNRTCWQVEVSTNFGRKRTLWIEKDTPLLVALEERVFMGQGDEFALRMQLESLQNLDAEQLAKVRKPFDMLLKLQADLQRGENEQKPELNDAQLATAKEVIGEIEKAAEETPFSRLASVISRDVKSQLQRTDEVLQLAKKFVGQPAPAFTLETLDKKTVTANDLAGKITVLHFWEYQGEPLVEPYGQVGYLDFLYSRRRKLGVQVFGVAVDERFGQKDKALPAVRSVHKLQNFMNLAFPIATDGGELIAKFGDPRRVGATLPLWVVIGPDGKVAHYSVGFYKINPDEGLRELDDLLVKLIKEQRGKADDAPQK
jgi:alkyl hydroperoxide reductase subunit AhpC